jgi:hypothetical protein
MTMRVNKIITYLQPDEAYTLIEFLDQLREMLMHTYGEDIRTLLHDASEPEFVPSSQGELDV